jgi:hypothetical protein
MTRPRPQFKDGDKVVYKDNGFSMPIYGIIIGYHSERYNPQDYWIFLPNNPTKSFEQYPYRAYTAHWSSLHYAEGYVDPGVPICTGEEELKKTHKECRLEREEEADFYGNRSRRATLAYIETSKAVPGNKVKLDSIDGKIWTVMDIHTLPISEQGMKTIAEGKNKVEGNENNVKT